MCARHTHINIMSRTSIAFHLKSIERVYSRTLYKFPHLDETVIYGFTCIVSETLQERAIFSIDLYSVNNANLLNDCRHILNSNIRMLNYWYPFYTIGTCTAALIKKVI